MLFNSAPRKFKNLGTDAFIVSRITKFFLVVSRCKCNKGVRSRQEHIKCHQLLTFALMQTDLRSWKVTLEIMCTQCNP